MLERDEQFSMTLVKPESTGRAIVGTISYNYIMYKLTANTNRLNWPHAIYIALTSKNSIGYSSYTIHARPYC